MARRLSRKEFVAKRLELEMEIDRVREAWLAAVTVFNKAYGHYTFASEASPEKQTARDVLEREYWKPLERARHALDEFMLDQGRNRRVYGRKR